MMLDNRAADPLQIVADLRRQLDQRTAEVEALIAERDEAIAQQTATAEVLQVINSSPGDLAPVFDAMLEKSARICRADSGFIFRLQDGLNRMVAAFGVPAEYKEFQARNPIPLGRGTLAGRIALERRAVHIGDAAADPEYTRAEAVQIGGQRTMLGVPLIREDALIGVITFGRSRVEPFTEKSSRSPRSRSHWSRPLLTRRSSRSKTRGCSMHCASARMISKSHSNTRPRPATCSRSSAARPSICNRCWIRCARWPAGFAPPTSAGLRPDKAMCTAMRQPLA